MTRIVHLSDTHFGTEVPAVLEALRDQVCAANPDLVVLSGDVTQRARSGEFRKARAFLDALPGAKLVIPGNHDIPLYNLGARLLAPYGGFRRHFGRNEAYWEDEQVLVMGFDTTSRLRHSRGALGRSHIARRLAQTKAQGQRAGGKLIIACLHQPLATALPQDASEIMIDAVRVAGDLSVGGVDAVLSGHVHFPLIGTTEEAFPLLPRAFVLVGAGTAVSHRTRSGAPNSFNIIETSVAPKSRIRIRQFCFDHAEKRFAESTGLSFRPGDHGWSGEAAHPLGLPE